jgi:hypothetical protein
MTIGLNTLLQSTKIGPATAPNTNWLEVNRRMAVNGQEKLYQLTMRDVSVAKLNSRIQSLVLTNIQTGVEFHTRQVWFKFCIRVIEGDVSNATFKVIKNSMSTWPEDIQRIWKNIMTVRLETKNKQDKTMQSVV